MTSKAIVSDVVDNWANFWSDRHEREVMRYLRDGTSIDYWPWTYSRLFDPALKKFELTNYTGLKKVSSWDRFGKLATTKSDALSITKDGHTPADIKGWPLLSRWNWEREFDDFYLPPWKYEVKRNYRDNEKHVTFAHHTYTPTSRLESPYFVRRATKSITYK